MVQGGGTEQTLKRIDEAGLTEVVKQGLVYFEREERDLHMLLFSETLEQVTTTDGNFLCVHLDSSMPVKLANNSSFS